MESKLGAIGVVAAVVLFGCGGATDDGADPAGGNNEHRSGPCPVKPAAGSEPVAVTVHVRAIVNVQPVAGAHVKLCREIDVTCERGEPPEGLVTDANGDATLMVAPGSTEYVQVTGNTDQFLPARYYFNPLTFGARDVNVQLATPEVRDALAGVLGTSQQPGRGIVLLNALTCQGTAAANVAFSSDVAEAATVRFYVEGALPNPALEGTNSTGFGGFLNMQAGAVTITGTAVESSRVLDSISVLVQPNAIIQGSLLRGD